MPKPIPANPFDQHSYSVPRNLPLCAHPSCNLPVPVPASLCELHGSRHKDHSDD